MTQTTQQAKTPQLRFKQPNGTEYPNWQSVRLGDVAVPITRSVGDKDLPSHSITAGVGFVSHMEKWGKDIAGKQKPKYLHIKKGEFVYNKGNSKTYTTGCIYLLNADNDVAVPNVFIAFFTDQKKLNSHFLSQFFIGDKHKIELRKYITSSARSDGLLNISKGDFFKMKVPMPHLDEQAKIADFLSIIDKRIKLLQAKYDNLQKYKTGILQKIFTQQIRFKNPNGKNYPDWQTKKLGDIAEIKTGDSNKQDSSQTGKYTFFDRSNDILKSSRYLFDAEAIIVGDEGQDFIPKYFIGKFDLHQRAYTILNFKNVSVKYAYYAIHMNKNYFLRMAVGSTVPSLRMNCFTTFEIPIPHKDEQDKIADFLSAIDEKITKTKTQITATKSFKQGLLQQMFT